MKSVASRRWSVVAIFFVFMLLHQMDQLLIGTLTPDIMASFRISMTQMGAVSTGALLVGAVFFPLWGYLYDRYGRARLLALAAFIWGATTWLNAIAPTYRAFLVTRSSTGVDDSSYPGLFSLVSDYFGPSMRGRVYGILDLAKPLGYLGGMVLALSLHTTIGWRGVFYITGSLGVVMSAVIFFQVREAPRGAAEPELQGVEQVSAYRFNWQTAKALFRKPTLRLLFAQGFFGVFPWQVISFWFFTYLERERGYQGTALLVTMAAAIIVLAVGYPLGGTIGDFLFRRTPRGRALTATAGVLIGAALLPITLNVPAQNQGLFLALLCVTAVFIPFASANVTSTVHDVALPEIRSTALGIENLIESAGAALAPLIAGVIADRSSLYMAILTICVSAWLLCGIFFALTSRVVPRDIEILRSQLRERAEREQALQPIPGLAGEVAPGQASATQPA